jgi:uncharacterized protein YbaR (Trm112 family)
MRNFLLTSYSNRWGVSYFVFKLFTVFVLLHYFHCPVCHYLTLLFFIKHKEKKKEEEEEILIAERRKKKVQLEEEFAQDISI